ncbi:CPBP family intramembrane glutamic endopeptidase [Candidatus Neptunochlamydia vexilliferae]|uniref:CAAX prenyl protease 2/Lysostaphin resistance protein A-like domain-containing protein n=1 Tax=Candidatus Neptunichlamydia vexilliferae TaxID=1651774 RepID=A0ABS0B1B2_9BACT|nr:CPBP family intramembrane glutamic endopeptidase [Candidatus Neptunochlamydia vexilliferae]MBF5060184.1 hypothetical protein [Candidatus Neptunochlamydia vexilliferae]
MSAVAYSSKLNVFYDSCLHDKIPKFLKSKKFLAVMVFMLMEGVEIGGVLNREVSFQTDGKFEIDTFVPEKARVCIRKVGIVTTNLALEFLGRMFFKDVAKRRLAIECIFAPIVEELVFRFPVLILDQGLNAIDSKYSRVLAKPLFSKLSRADTIRIAAVIASAIFFTYAHGSCLQPERCGRLFMGGLILNAIALHSERLKSRSGLAAAIFAHAFLNFRINFRLALLPRE